MIDDASCDKIIDADRGQIPDACRRSLIWVNWACPKRALSKRQMEMEARRHAQQSIHCDVGDERVRQQRER